MKKILLIGIITIILGCSKDSSSDISKCNCTKTLYLYYPPMNSVGVNIPGRYEVVGVSEVEIDCNVETNVYVYDPHTNYTHYKINCE